ncbi:MAG: glycine cleavage system protein GcvH [Chloroflexi bacterium]|nr:glycine cleavage system protein GcvH [Chloroflexota bacterium]
MSDKNLNYAADRKYHETHEWVKLDGDPSAGPALAVVGISDYAQDQLGDVVFIELPAVGAAVEQGKAFGVIESVKAASDLFAPLSGKIEAVNEKLRESPETVNKDPFGEGWLLKIRFTNPAELDKLLDAATYQSKIEAGEIH